MVIEMRVPDYTLEESHPERHHHLGAARAPNITEIDHVCRLPAKPFTQELCDLFLRRDIVPTDKEVMVARDAGRFDHDLAIHACKGLHHQASGSAVESAHPMNQYCNTP